ncbi:methyltransferase (TIGR00027 family) [Bradyrhizobium sp. GM24.11]
MHCGQPSRTARGAAGHRAVHQMLEGGAIFKDPLASRILDEQTATSLNAMAADDSLRPWRLFIAARSRFSEDTMANCVVAGARQIVILGAGLDTFALRNPFVDLGARVFEVDYAATQSWKRERMKAAGLIEPKSLIFAPIDFERESLSGGLTRVGFESNQPTFFQWLGVVPYLTKEAISSTLKFISKVPQAVVVFDYAEPFQNYPAERRASVRAVAERTAAQGEPWLSLFDPCELHNLLRGHGLYTIEDLGLPEIATRLYGDDLRRGITIGPGPHIVRASGENR